MLTAPNRIIVSWGGFLCVRLIVLLLGFSALWIAIRYTPDSPPPGLKCVVKELTGYPCPACGITRGLTALVHGRIQEAHVNFPFVIPVFIGLWIGLIGAVLPDDIWRKIMKTKWVIWIICSGAGLTGAGILGHWFYRLIFQIQI